MWKKNHESHLHAITLAVQIISSRKKDIISLGSLQKVKMKFENHNSIKITFYLKVIEIHSKLITRFLYKIAITGRVGHLELGFMGFSLGLWME